MIIKDKNDFKCVLIITACIQPRDIPFLKRNSELDRLNDYKIAFRKWCKNKFVNNLIFVENSGYDLSYFQEELKKFPEKRIEILSSNLNETFNKSLGKGYGEHLCFTDVIKRSKLFRENEYFFKISGRYYVKNFFTIYEELNKKKSDVFVFLKDNLKFADSHLFGGSNKFFSNYVVPSSSQINDSKNFFMEHCLAKSVLKAINDDLKFNIIETYPNISGIIGTNNKKIKINLYKKIKLYFFYKLKNYFFLHKKY